MLFDFKRKEQRSRRLVLVELDPLIEANKADNKER